MAGTMEQVLRRQRDAVLRDYIVRLRSISESYKRRPDAELRQTSGMAFDAAMAFMFNKDPKPMDRFVDFLVEKRLKAQFKLSDVQKAFSGLRNAVVPVLTRGVPHNELEDCLALLNECSDYAVNIFSEKYQRMHETDLVRVNHVLSAVLNDLRREKSNVVSANRLKDEFLANVSHEFKTPLNGIIGFSKIMMEGEGADPKGREKLRVIYEQGKALLRMINTLFVIAEIDAGSSRMSRDAVDFKDLLDLAIKNVRKLKAAEGHSINVSCAPDTPVVICDSEKMLEVIFELVLNSLKFSEPGSGVDVALKQKGENLLLSVRDRGVGIDAAEFNRIFSPFYQLDGSITRRYGGNGLGLTMIKKVMELHRGHVSVESNPGKGSTFTVEFPLVPPAVP